MVLFMLGGGQNDVDTVTRGASNIAPISVTNVAKANEGFAVNVTPTIDDDTDMPSTKLDTAESIPLTSTFAGNAFCTLLIQVSLIVMKRGLMC
ncbi:hypothetical protein Tco_0590243 [Tanacetum coccineum]